MVNDSQSVSAPSGFPGFERAFTFPPNVVARQQGTVEEFKTGSLAAVVTVDGV